MTDFPEGNAIVYCEGAFATTNGKTAHGLVRRTRRYRVLSVVDSRYSGKDAGEILDGRANGIAVFESVKDAFRNAEISGTPASHLVVGLAPDGGRLTVQGKEDVKEAVRLGLNVDCGLHDLLSEDREVASLAKKYKVRIRDIRKPLPRESLHFFCGKIEEVSSLTIAVLGTDSAIGKRTTAWILAEAFERAGLSVEIIGTGQTAWMQGVGYGIILDALINDFVTGEIEHAVWQAWKEKRPDVIIIEGQGSLLNPAYPGGMEILSAGRPRLVVLQHAPARKVYDGFPGYVLHPLDVQINAIEVVSSARVAAVTVNHENIADREIDDVCRQMSADTGLPVSDVLRSGADHLIGHLLAGHARFGAAYRERTAKTFKAPKKGLRNLVVIDDLEIGPVRVERDRFIAPYSVRRGGTVDTFNLIYRYEEDVFDPDDPCCVNLAHIVAAQLGINYGLFADRIVFHGPYDGNDRAFIREMVENTSREIYVKKFLEPNPFLVRSFQDLPVLRLESYTNARVVFPDETSKPCEEEWNGREGAAGILLSGGKESLLSYGLLNEIGLDTHPVFINESGRHWYTALNSYRHFKKSIPNTARVWTNSDRGFVWMVRHLPFIRHDFSDLRADDYPIRLWTVAVFLFGVLPILRKRNAGLLVIGDEYDTTRKAYSEGIPHYDGLYDQSRFFDLRLTKYFSKKRWKITQFSVVRPLSELLVLKLLVERYPELQRHQVSCHMAHIEGERAFPCGRCEKCHRIVGMLEALGAGPGRCGYNDVQIAECLARLPQKALHQESASSRQTLHLLAGRNLIDDSAAAAYEPHEEVEHLRFHKEISPKDVIPDSIREKIIGIQMEHSRGALRWEKGEWVSFEP